MIDRPLVGVLYNPTTPALMAHAGALVEHVSVMPDRLWFDFGVEAAGRGLDEHLRAQDQGRAVIGVDLDDQARIVVRGAAHVRGDRMHREADGRGGFWCAGENGRLRLVQKSA